MIRNVVPGLAGEALQSEGAAGVEGETRQVSHEAARSGSACFLESVHMCGELVLAARPMLKRQPLVVRGESAPGLPAAGPCKWRSSDAARELDSPATNTGSSESNAGVVL